MKKEINPFNGILPIYKEAGFTSNDVVAKLRGILHMRKIGHTGTLDPAATGVLPVCLGKGTSLVSMLTDTDKTYVCRMRLGITTDTEDTTGKLLKCLTGTQTWTASDTAEMSSPEEDDFTGDEFLARRHHLIHLSESDVRKAAQNFVGEYDQIPPMYSAKKVDGRKLYELAREGKVIERKPSRVTIYSIDVQDFTWQAPPVIMQKEYTDQDGVTREKTVMVTGPVVTMEISCGKGTYIRSLCRDIGEKLGVGAAMEELTRTRAAGFTDEEALTLDEVESLMKEIGVSGVEKHIHTVESVFADYPELTVSGRTEHLVWNGNAFQTDAPDGTYRVKIADGAFAALYEINGGNAKLIKYFLDKEAHTAPTAETE
ncbi:tRNA pseudouridine55 synthase [Lachnospiraceae bacterium]|nr:tRNA pseudouridine55 synthase [Lachnospiraceae bacterium]